ncbi:MAG: outer membrane protein [Flavobacteriaceae bacterium]
MKTSLRYALLLLTLFAYSAFAQTEKGKFLVGASTLLNTGVIEHSRVRDKVTTLSERITHFSLTPHAGYFIKDNLALGAELSVSFSNTKDYDYNVELRESTIAFSPFVRYYFGTKKVRPLVHVSGGIGSYKDNYIASSPEYNYESTSTLFCYSIGAGAGVFLTDRISIDLELGYGGISSKINDDVRGRQNAFGLNAGFSFFF